ncbi:predicted protein [Uncinocarpus reesii 1704]|uniref:Uncharacterized protein n=1 Tax=Uncinocarpus reesii (strain UAMH 1704) TaxID=336963 RepID=C4JT30_UNCRE|nr:uncharacterized protein UREG_05619 [Uncinocarpus reesii 1704]EEP80777.1 predicted protein [Uncinocarpus reesii 1704]
MSPDMTSSDSNVFVLEDEALTRDMSKDPKTDQEIKLTTTILIVPTIITTIPEEMTILQNANPKDSWLVASLLRFPRVDTPMTIMLRLKYPRNTFSSETMRKTRTSEYGQTRTVTLSALTTDAGNHHMCYGVEEKEFADNERFNQHNSTSSDYGEKSNDVHGPDNIQDHVPWTSQG